VSGRCEKIMRKGSVIETYEVRKKVKSGDSTLIIMEDRALNARKPWCVERCTIRHYFDSREELEEYCYLRGWRTSSG